MSEFNAGQETSRDNPVDRDKGPEREIESLPLSRITVLDLAGVGPGSRCCQLLADYGANVVKVEPLRSASGLRIEAPYFAYSGHRGMRRIRLDLKTDDGRQAVLSLASKADVCVESFRPGVVDRLGIGYEVVRTTNPAIIYCSTTGYGQYGTRSQWAGHDLDYLALGGYLSMSGTRGDGGPPVPGASIADAAAGGMHAALAITAALAGRGPDEEGAYLDVSVAQGVLWLMSGLIDEHLATGAPVGPGSGLLNGGFAFYDSYRTADRKWLAVAAIEPKFFANLCRAIHCEQWVEHQMDPEMQEQIRVDFAAAFASHDRAYWILELAGMDACVAPVLTISDIVSDEEYASRGVFTEAVHPIRGRFRQLAPLLAGMSHSSETVMLPDEASTDTDALLAEVGVSPAVIAQWRSNGAIE